MFLIVVDKDKEEGFVIVKWFYVIGYNILVMEGIVGYLKEVLILVKVVGKIG